MLGSNLKLRRHDKCSRYSRAYQHTAEKKLEDIYLNWHAMTTLDLVSIPAPLDDCIQRFNSVLIMDSFYSTDEDPDL